MKKQSSYIFFEHPFKKEKDAESKDSVIVVEIDNNVSSFISMAFPMMSLINVEKSVFVKEYTGVICSCSVEFILHEVIGVEYLDIIVEGKTTSRIIKCLEHIQSVLFNSGIREYYVEIISYDCISEYYCNKMVGKLNSLERNLRALLFNIYILNFGKDYYQATMSSDLQSKIKGLINSTTSKEQKEQIKKDYKVSAKEAEIISRLQQFFYSFELADIQKFLFEPNWTNYDEDERFKFLSENIDLTNLSDAELRKAFARFSPKSDWDRFFSTKIHIDNINELIDSIRKYRNSVAHFKSFNYDDYSCCGKCVRELNDAIVEAIRITKRVDFAEKNINMIKKSLYNFAEKCKELLEPLLRQMQRATIKGLRNLIENIDIIKSKHRLAVQLSKRDDESIEKNDVEDSQEDASEND